MQTIYSISEAYALYTERKGCPAATRPDWMKSSQRDRAQLLASALGVLVAVDVIGPKSAPSTTPTPQGCEDGIHTYLGSSHFCAACGDDCMAKAHD